MKFTLLSLPFCRVYYLVCGIMLLWMLGAKITGPEVILPGVSDEPFLRPGYYTLVMMNDEGQWHKIFAEDKSKGYPEGYTWDNVYQYYTLCKSPWPVKSVGKVICWTTAALFAVVLLSPFWHRLKGQTLWFSLLTALFLPWLYWLHWESGEDMLLQSGEYAMTIPCLMVWAGCLYRMIFCRRMQWDRKLGQAALTTGMISHRRGFMLCALLAAVGVSLILLILSGYLFASVLGFFLYNNAENVIRLLCLMILVAAAALLIVFFPKKVAAVLV